MAGIDSTAATGIELDGSSSSDPDGDTLSFAWTTDCPGGAFDDAASATPSLTVDPVQLDPSSDPCSLECSVMLTVTDPGELSDSCETAVTIYGAEIWVTASKHTVGSGSSPGSAKEPLVGIEVCAYDKSEGSCARQQDQQGNGISHQEYDAIARNCEPVSCCTTDANGEANLILPPGDYVIISVDATKTVLPDPLGVSASDLVCGEHKQKHLQKIVKANGKKVPGKTTRRIGSELLIIEPEFVVWDSTEQLYPFVFESVGDWGVTTSVAPPEGFVSDFASLSAEVSNAVEAVQFTITEVGSDLVPTETTFEVSHAGRSEIIRSQVSIFLTPQYARGRGFNVANLRAQGLIKNPPGRGPPGRGR